MIAKHGSNDTPHPSVLSCLTESKTQMRMLSTKKTSVLSLAFSSKTKWFVMKQLLIFMNLVMNDDFNRLRLLRGMLPIDFPELG